MTLTQKIAAYAMSFNKATIEPEIMESAQEIVRDCFGCILGGMDDPVVQNMGEYYQERRQQKLATVIGVQDRKLIPEYAALTNAMAAHVRDFDDICMAAEGHPTVAVFPVTLALCEALGLSGAELIEAYIAGVEITGLLGRTLFSKHYSMGWDTTGTLGIFGTTVAAAKLMGLTEKQFVNALGIAATEASGLRASYGTMAKDLTAGRTAAKGIYAATMAHRGFDANPLALEDKSGLLAVSSNGIDVELFDRIIEERISTFREPGMIMKRYPSCRGTHNAIDAALRIAEQPGFVADEIESVLCEAEPAAIENDRYPYPKTPMQGKFSIPYCVAAALQNKHVGLRDFSGDQIQDLAVEALCHKVSVKERQQGFTPGKGGTEIVVKMNNGMEYRETVDIAKGDPDNRLNRQELESKFMEIACAVMPESSARALYERLESMQSIVDIGGLLEEVNQNLLIFG